MGETPLLDHRLEWKNDGHIGTNRRVEPVDSDASPFRD